MEEEQRFRCGRVAAEGLGAAERRARLEERVKSIAGPAAPQILDRAQLRADVSVLTFAQALEREFDAWQASQ